MKVSAACCAATTRLGVTSVADIDDDTSNTSMIRPSLPMRSVVLLTGRAVATTPAASPSTCSDATTWRCHDGRCGDDAVEQVDLREPNGGGPPPPQHRHVRHGERGGDHEQPQPFRVQEVHVLRSPATP